MRTRIIAVALSISFAAIGSHASAGTNYVECGVNSSDYETGVISKLSVPQRRGRNVIAIRGGEFGSIDEMPGLVNLNLFSSYVTDHNGEVIYSTQESCGATRISRDLILTAAHCLQSGQESVEINYGVSNV